MRDAGILDTGIEIHESGIRESGIGNRESGYGIRDMGIWGYGDMGIRDTSFATTRIPEAVCSASLNLS